MIDANLRIFGLGKVANLHKLPQQTKNKVRAILSSDAKTALSLLNQLRVDKSPSQLMQIDLALQSYVVNVSSLIPDAFPVDPQTSEHYHRLDSTSLKTELGLISLLVRRHSQELSKLLVVAKRFNNSLLNHDFIKCSKIIGEWRSEFGYSNFLLRKACLIRVWGQDFEMPEVELLLKDCGVESNNIFVSTLINCYKEEQDYFGLKKSIMGLPSRGLGNKYTRDICRLPFQPIAKDEQDLAQLLQSNRQSSLIDAIIIAKINLHLAGDYFRDEPHMLAVLNQLNSCSGTLDEVSSLFVTGETDGEFNFYKRSSGWLEIQELVPYRTLLDNFYDAPDSSHIDLSETTLRTIEKWVDCTELQTLATKSNFTTHNIPHLKILEDSGSMTRSALFNYLLHISQGFTQVEENDLFNLMGVTRDLAKTANPLHLSNLAKLSTSKYTKLILYFLIARRSKNERDNHLLRKVLQDVVRENHNCNLVDFFVEISSRSKAVAEYAYEVCTEDFIAKLFDLINSAAEITETRAALHKWMGHFTGEKVYLDRARILLIDHQLNKIRNEIDDNRIYVDSARFAEWINDEIMRDLNGIFASMGHKSGLMESEDPQLIKIVEICYLAFCSNNIFGIASYLGRRIRHGTFKGHLFSSVVAITRNPKYRYLLSDLGTLNRWNNWKSRYEEKIDKIIKERLHIESATKRDGLVKPATLNQSKTEILASCARLLRRDFIDTKSSLGSVALITEYCWRLAEYDLKNINSFLKNKKADLIDRDLLQELKASVPIWHTDIATEFCRDITKSIDDKLQSMYTWFKRPINVSPKASLSLLYKAVVEEVRESFGDFSTDTDFEEYDDIEIYGGAYHILYDSFYVVVFNAAKHGKAHSPIQKSFKLASLGELKFLSINITSELKDGDSEEFVSERLKLNPEDDTHDAQVSEDRSGIRKLHHLMHCNSNFLIHKIECVDRKVNVALDLILEH